MSQVMVMSGVERHRVWTDDQKRALVAAACEPGASVAEIARRADLRASQLYRWRRDLVEPVSAGFAAVICSASAHVENDECGAPEFFSNRSKLLVATTESGKLTPEAVRALATSRSDIHFLKPRAVTITQPTESDQVYTIAEITALSALCRELGLRHHMDLARFANACASLGCSAADITLKTGVDLLRFNGTKNGMAVGEAILFFDRDLATDFAYRCKQASLLVSKMRFLAARGWVCSKAVPG